MTEGSVRTKMVVFGALGLAVFATPFLYSVSQQSEPGKTSVTATATRQPAAQLFRGPVMLSSKQIRSMTETHMKALFEGAHTGNYAALHALGAPSFRERNSPATLRQIFSTVWQEDVDPKPILKYVPEEKGKPYFDDRGMLHLAGYYPTEPLQVHYALTLQAVERGWRLFGISVETVLAP